ncbi:MAG: hypothetical protein LBF37_03885 [Rickettsiales bacterium]|jgi:hypothetical protein|nr:hypothetical protein [Rickettsiales bacterium]
MPVTEKSQYNFKKLLPMIILALSPVVFTACDKDGDEEPLRTTQQYITAGVPGNRVIYPLVGVEKDGKDKSVGTIQILSDGTDFQRYPIWKFREILEEELIPLANGKHKFGGKLENMLNCTTDGIGHPNPTDSLWLVKQGFVFGNMAR